MKHCVVFLMVAFSSVGWPENKNQKAIEVKTQEVVSGESFEVGSSQNQLQLYPSNWGLGGTFRVRSAESFPKGALTFGIGGEYFNTSSGPEILSVGAGPTRVSTLAESLFVGYTPIDHLSLGLTRRNSSTTFSPLGQRDYLVSSLGDFYFSALYSFNLTQRFAVAPVATILVASNFDDLLPSGTTLSAGFGMAATASLYPDLGVPLFVHANLLYHMPQIRTSKQNVLVEPETFFQFSRYNTVTLLLGAEFKLTNFVPFAEVSQTVHTNSTLGFGQSPLKMTIGTRIMPFENKGLCVLVGTDVGLINRYVAGVPFSPGFQLIAQLSYTFGFSDSERHHYATTEDVKVVDRKFVIGKTIQFKVASSELDPISNGLLDQIAEVIQKNGVKKLLIVGHTDSSMGEDFNLKLSLDRANTVKRYLVGKGIADEVFSTQGYGKRKPKASNATEEGRSQNRRVEFFILE